MWQMVGILAELERSLIQERTKAGRAAAQARGVKMGRKPLLTAQQVAHARTLLERGESPSALSILKIRVPSMGPISETGAYQGGFSWKKSILCV